MPSELPKKLAEKRDEMFPFAKPVVESASKSGVQWTRYNTNDQAGVKGFNACYAEIAPLVEALVFYGTNDINTKSFDWRDNGKRARKALASVLGEE